MFSIIAASQDSKNMKKTNKHKISLLLLQDERNRICGQKVPEIEYYGKLTIAMEIPRKDRTCFAAQRSCWRAPVDLMRLKSTLIAQKYLKKFLSLCCYRSVKICKKNIKKQV